MSTIHADPRPLSCDAEAARCGITSTPTRDTELGPGLVIRRALPHRDRRLVGPWCFLDHFGPVPDRSDAVRVGPHPHIGLQTVTWLYSGQILHRDSLGSLQSIRPGQLNLMTAGRGISHSEESQAGPDLDIHGLQFWLALPSGHMAIAPAFEHYDSLPSRGDRGIVVTVFVGGGFGMRSPALVHSPLVGMDLRSRDGGDEVLTLDPGFEHAIYIAEGALEVDGIELAAGELHYLGSGREQIELRCTQSLRAALIGGEPRPVPLRLWWNFVADSDDEIVAARSDWTRATARFGEVLGYEGPRLIAPPLAKG